MSSGLTSAAVLRGLRWWAQGALPDQAAVELLARSSGGRLLCPGVAWVRPCRQPGWYWLDPDALIEHAATLPEGPQRHVMLLAAAARRRRCDPSAVADPEGSGMSVVEVLQFAVAVQLAAGVVTMVNVVLSRLRGRS